MHDSQGQIPRARGRAGTTRMIARAVALFIAVSFAVVGIAGPSSAHHNTISGSVSCKAGGGWTVTPLVPLALKTEVGWSSGIAAAGASHASPAASASALLCDGL